MVGYFVPDTSSSPESTFRYGMMTGVESFLRSCGQNVSIRFELKTIPDSTGTRQEWWVVNRVQNDARHWLVHFTWFLCLPSGISFWSGVWREHFMLNRGTIVLFRDIPSWFRMGACGIRQWINVLIFETHDMSWRHWIMCIIYRWNSRHINWRMKFHWSISSLELMLLLVQFVIEI